MGSTINATQPPKKTICIKSIGPQGADTRSIGPPGQYPVSSHVRISLALTTRRTTMGRNARIYQIKRDAGFLWPTATPTQTARSLSIRRRYRVDLRAAPKRIHLPPGQTRRASQWTSPAAGHNELIVVDGPSIARSSRDFSLRSPPRAASSSKPNRLCHCPLEILGIPSTFAQRAHFVTTHKDENARQLPYNANLAAVVVQSKGRFP